MHYFEATALSWCIAGGEAAFTGGLMLAELAEMTRLFRIFGWHTSCLVASGTPGNRGQDFYST